MANKKYVNDIKAWNEKKAELEAASQSSLANYDPTAALRKTPGYEFRYNTGLDTTQNYLNRLGMTQSGRAQKELTDYGQNFASGEYNNEFNRRLALINPSLAALGASSGLQSQGIIGQSNLYGARGAADSAYYGDLNSILQGSLSNYLTARNTPSYDNRSSSYRVPSSNREIV